MEPMRRCGVVVSPLSPSGSSSDVADWLSRHLPEMWSGEAAAAARDTGLDASSLLKMNEEEAARALGVSIFGRKRKLSLLLADAKAARQPSSSADPASAALRDARVKPDGCERVKPCDSAAGSSSADAGSSFAHGAVGASRTALTAAAPPGAVGASRTAPTAAAPPGSRDEPALDAAACDAQLHDETYALGLVRWVGGKLQDLLSKPEHAAWATAGLRAARLQELSGLREHSDDLPGVSVVVVGNTGAGKSTLLNGLLGEASILPTNGMRACTACLIEMRHEESDPARSPLYRAEVEFMTQAEWDKELADLLDDLTPNDGPVRPPASTRRPPRGRARRAAVLRRAVAFR